MKRRFTMFHAPDGGAGGGGGGQGGASSSGSQTTTTTANGSSQQAAQSLLDGKVPGGSQAGTQGVQPPPAGAGADQQAGQKPADAKAADAKAQSVPEKYEFKFADGVKVDQAALDGFTPIAKELGLSQEAAQKAVNYYAQLISTQAQAAQRAQVERLNALHAEASKLPPAVLSAANRALAAFASPALLSQITSSSIGRDPQWIQFFGEIGKLVTEDKMIRGGGGGDKLSLAKSIYNKSNLN